MSDRLLPVPMRFVREHQRWARWMFTAQFAEAKPITEQSE